MKNLLFFFLILIPIFLFSQDKKPMSIIDFLNIPNLSNPQLSPNGNHVAYVKYNSDWKENKRIGQIWISEVSSKSARQFTYSTTGSSNPRWSPDGKELIFSSKRDGDEQSQVYRIAIDGGEASRLFEHPTSPRSIQWSEDGRFIYFLAKDEKSEELKGREKVDDDVYAYDEDFQQSHLWRFVFQADSAQKLSEGDYSVLNFDVGKGGVIMQRGASPLFDKRPQTEVWLSNLDGSNGRALTSNSISEGSVHLSPSGNKFCFVSFANENFDFYYNDNLFISGTSGILTPSCPTAKEGFEVNSVRWGKDDNQIFLHVNKGATTQIFQLDLARDYFKEITTGNHNIGSWSYNSDLDAHTFLVNTMESPGEVHVLKKGVLTKVTNHLQETTGKYAMPKQEVIKWKGNDGVDVEGVIYYPVNYRVGQAYPLVVQTHGGPASSDKYGLSLSFTRYNPVLTGHGYVVLQPNYRGSTGYGDAFLRDMVGGYFRQSHLDVMAGVDYLIAQGIADPDRMIKMGWSAGGHMTNKLITFTDRFKAASSGAGAINWISMYGQSDVRTYRTPWFGGTPWEENAPIDTYWENSPLKDIHKVKTPTLIIVGGNDPRVPPPQSIELLRALKGLGVPSHLYVAPREPHGWQELRHRLYKINVELDWFAKYALDKSYEWEVAPEH